MPHQPKILQRSIPNGGATKEQIQRSTRCNLYITVALTLDNNQARFFTDIRYDLLGKQAQDDKMRL
jgi:hypothetical protein